MLPITGKDTILVVYNRLSKIMYFVIIIEETSVKKLVRLFKDNMWKLHGLPESIISDKDSQFVTDLTRELN